jgi:hypothetical protein
VALGHEGTGSLVMTWPWPWRVVFFVGVGVFGVVLGLIPKYMAAIILVSIFVLMFVVGIGTLVWSFIVIRRIKRDYADE